MKTLRVPDLARARAEHAAIGILLDRFEAALSEDAPPPGLLALRDELVGALTAHLRYEDWVIYPWLLAQQGEAAGAARRLIAELHDFVAFATRYELWTAERIAADWPGYRAHATRMGERLRARIACEDRELYAPLIEAGKLRAA